MVKRKSVLSFLVVAILLLTLLAVSCAKPAAEPAAEEPTAPAPAEPTTPPPAAPAAPTPPNIPAGHATAGCPVCHSQGVGGAPKWPDNHASFTEQMCAGCHKSG